MSPDRPTAPPPAPGPRPDPGDPQPAHAAGSGPSAGSSAGGEPAIPTPPHPTAPGPGEHPPDTAGPEHRSSALTAAAHASASSRSGGGFYTGQTDRERFGTDELTIVLSHYDLGVIEAVQEFPKGSRRAPKVILRSEKGLFLLKRRARGKDDLFKVAFAHALQMHLARHNFPLPRLVGTRRHNNSMVHWKGQVYELFEYIKGSGYDNSLAATTDAGRTLALFHKLLRNYHPEYEPPRGSYHAARSVASAMQAVPHTLASADPDAAAEHAQRIDQVVRFLHSAYNEAATRANECGLPDWPMQIVHSDWHPGNMLFRGAKVVSVIDYDSARVQQRVIDVANGALQMSILGGGDDPQQWPDYVDEGRFRRFLRGYDSVPECVLSRAEIRAIPWLMIEALIAETIIPIAATGSFAQLDGIGFLLMVERKVRWLQAYADTLIESVDK